MSGQTHPKKGKPAILFALAVPVGIILTSALVPLKPIMQQALIGITLIWLGVGALICFDL
jgi:hypothetical protein